MRLAGPYNSGIAAGGAGVATNNASTSTRLVGKVAGIYVKYNDTPPATTDVTVATVGTSPAAPSYTLLSLTNAATDGWFYPQVQIHTSAGAAIAGEYTPFLVFDFVNILVAQANNGDSVDVWFLLE